MRAISTPNRLAVRHSNVVKRTELGTFSATYAVVFCVKILCRKLVFAPNGVEGKRNCRFEKKNVPCAQLVDRHNIGSSAVELTVRGSDPFLYLLLGKHWVGIVCNVISRHLKLGVSVTYHLFGFENLFQKNK
jgi:hypothetical protein